MQPDSGGTAVKYALFSDVHSKLPALEAVLRSESFFSAMSAHLILW